MTMRRTTGSSSRDTRDNMTIDASLLSTASRRRGITQQQQQQQHQYIRDLYEFQVERNNGLPVSLSCSSAADTGNPPNNSNATTTLTNTTHPNNNTNDTRQILDTTISFDYELTLRDPVEGLVEVLSQDLPKWEFFLLYYVAQDIGLIGCQEIGQQNITRNQDSNNTSFYSVDVVNLSSFGSDVVDTRVGT